MAMMFKLAQSAQKKWRRLRACLQYHITTGVVAIQDRLCGQARGLIRFADLGHDRLALYAIDFSNAGRFC